MCMYVVACFYILIYLPPTATQRSNLVVSILLLSWHVLWHI